MAVGWFVTPAFLFAHAGYLLRSLILPSSNVIHAMYGLAYVLIPTQFASLQSELDRTLAPFKRGGDDAFPREKLTFEDATEWLARLHRAKFRYNVDGSLNLLENARSICGRRTLPSIWPPAGSTPSRGRSRKSSLILTPLFAGSRFSQHPIRRRDDMADG